ncbi:transcriptional regulator, LysR family [Francisella tularensis]|uniref:Transcriptional regulator, LysR family n=1 Tax=Francisella tularensis TaxID=263 RepID=A0AAW3D6T5_FRATU|nr:transcriptional regulator, LysR family [Francisella tularensis]KFJ43039.1 transcriptional regulator, LysR family [Francisella tularensis]
MSAIHKDIIEATRYFLKLVELGSYSSVKKYYNVELNTIKIKYKYSKDTLTLNLSEMYRIAYLLPVMV